MNPRLAKLKQWKGIPIPAFVTWRTDGVPDFKVVSEDHRKKCVTERVCFVCGEALGWWKVFIGGPHSIGKSLFVDGPMHPECADDAVEICPFLAGRMDYAVHFDLSKHLSKVEFTTGTDRQHEPPTKIGRYVCRDFSVVVWRDPKKPDNGAWFFHAGKAKEIKWQERK